MTQFDTGFSVDPPFGSNISYSGQAVIWDAWLGSTTDQGAEIVVDQRRSRLAPEGKEYRHLRSDFRREVIQSRRAQCLAAAAAGVRGASPIPTTEVWTALQDSAIADAGLDVLGAHVLDKGQPCRSRSERGISGQEHSDERGSRPRALPRTSHPANTQRTVPGDVSPSR